MIIAVGANQRGCGVRDQVVRLLKRLGHQLDTSAGSLSDSAEYPQIAAQVARSVHEGRAERGILIGRTGTGMCIMANRFSGVRAAVCYDEVSAETSRRYLDVNVLCLSGELVGQQLIEQIVQIWLETPFDGGRHARRIEQIAALEP